MTGVQTCALPIWCECPDDRLDGRGAQAFWDRRPLSHCRDNHVVICGGISTTVVIIDVRLGLGLGYFQIVICTYDHFNYVKVALTCWDASTVNQHSRRQCSGRRLYFRGMCACRSYPRVKLMVLPMHEDQEAHCGCATAYVGNDDAQASLTMEWQCILESPCAYGFFFFKTRISCRTPGQSFN